MMNFSSTAAIVDVRPSEKASAISAVRTKIAAMVRQ
jgi:hypothetical protein